MGIQISPVLIENANKGYPVAQRKVAIIYWKTHQYEIARKWLKKAAAKKDAEAALLLAIGYKNGKLKSKDNKPALDWCLKAMEYGSIEARLAVLWLSKHTSLIPERNKPDDSFPATLTAKDSYLLGKWFMSDASGTKDYVKAVSFLKNAANFGHPMAMYWLGIIYREGRPGVEPDASNARHWLAEAACKECKQAYYPYAMMCSEGAGGKADYTQVSTYLPKAADVSNCYTAQAQYQIGMYSREGEKGFNKNPELSVRYWKKVFQNTGSGQLMHTKSAYRLALAYINGTGVGASYEEAEKYFSSTTGSERTEIAAKLGHAYYAKNRKNTGNAEKAFPFYEEAAKSGDAESQHYCGYMLMHGIGVPKDCKRAEQMLIDSAEQGHGTSMFILGQAYWGRIPDMPVDRAKAVRYYVRSAEAGLSDAQYECGMIYSGLYNRKYGKQVETDYPKAAEYFQAAADQGNIEAAYQLAELYYWDRAGMQHDYKKAFKLYLKAADSGNADAQFQVGYMYDVGQGVQKDRKKAIPYFEKAAAQNDRVAMYNLGQIYWNGRQGISIDRKTAFNWYQKAADRGYPKAQYKCGTIYAGTDKHSGEVTEINYPKAAEYFQAAADQGNMEAAYQLAELYYREKAGMRQDYEKAFKLYLKVADSGDADAQFRIGYMYDNGQGIPKDSKKAIPYYEKAAAQDNAEAMYHLGNIYWDGRSDINIDRRTALNWYQKSADKGHADAQYTCGTIYAGTDKHSGEVAEINYPKAAEYFQAATDQGDMEAAYQLAELYYWDRAGMHQDYEKAFKLYLKAADSGNRNAQFRVGYMYNNGEGVPKGSNKAILYYEKAAAQNDSVAMYNLGYIYWYGRSGISIDRKAAFNWYQKAADKRDADAQYKCGTIYAGTDKHSGEVAEINYPKAAEYFQAAADQGNTEAAYQLAELYYWDRAGMHQDYEKAFKLYLKAANSRNVNAQFRVGYMYDVGQGIPKDSMKAIPYFEKAAAQDNTAAMHHLGNIYWWYPKIKNKSIALKWYLQAAEKDYTDAQVKCGEIYGGILACSELIDYLQAKHYLHLAAGKENPKAQYHLGFLYGTNRELTEDDFLEAASSYLSSGIANGLTGETAQQIVKHYGKQVFDVLGSENGVERVCQECKLQASKDSVQSLCNTIRNPAQTKMWETWVSDWNKKQALFWKTKSADNGYRFAQNDIIRICLDGKGSKQDCLNAIRYIRSILQKNNKPDEIHYKNKLANLLWKQLPGKENKQEAWELFMQLSEQQDTHAKYQLGLIYQTGEAGFTEQNHAAAFRYFKEINEQTVKRTIRNRSVLSGAGYWLGYYLWYGYQGIAQDKTKAIDYWKQSWLLSRNISSYYELQFAKTIDVIDESTDQPLNEENNKTRIIAALSELHERYWVKPANGIVEDKAKAVFMLEELQKYKPDTLVERLAVAYKTGIGAPKDEEKAEQYFQAASRSCSQEYLFAQGNQLAIGDNGYKKDIDCAVRLWEAAAEKGHSQAAYSIFLYLHEAEDTEKRSKADYYLERAANLGHQDAVKEIAYRKVCKMTGSGVIEDMLAAYQIINQTYPEDASFRVVFRASLTSFFKCYKARFNGPADKYILSLDDIDWPGYALAFQCPACKNDIYDAALQMETEHLLPEAITAYVFAWHCGSRKALCTLLNMGCRNSEYFIDQTIIATP